MMPPKFKCICFTLNNYSEEEYNDLITCNLFKYLIIGKEIGDKGTPHLQGYGEFVKQIRSTQIKKINNRMHFESRKGSQAQAIAYCKKDNKFVEIGEKKIQGKRNDLLLIRDAIKGGSSYKDILETYELNGSQIRVLETYFSYLEGERKDKPIVKWIYGKSGAGKTKYVYDTYASDVYKKDETKWWDGYDKQKVCLLDDFRGSHMKFTYLLSLLDRYPHRVEIKGGFRQFDSKIIIITSNKHPKDVYNKEDEEINQLLRRIDEIIEMPIASEVGVILSPTSNSYSSLLYNVLQ